MAASSGKFPACAIAAALAFTAVPLHAQESTALSQEEVTSFFEDMTQEITTMVGANDFEGMLELTERVIADEAHFYVSIDSYVGDDRKTFSVMSLSKQEVTELGRLALGVMAGAQGQQGAIEDFTLSFDIRDVTPAGADAATVVSHITETATLSFSAGSADGEDAESATAQPAAGDGSIAIEAVTDCHMLVRRAEAEGELLLGLSACNASLRH